MNGKNTERLVVDGPAGKLQSIYETVPNPKASVLVCHPHPLYGGTMRNKVVYWMARAFLDYGCNVLRFNFRGVEESDGEWGDGLGETEDALAALHWLQDKSGGDKPLWLAGFSFGCFAGLGAAMQTPEVERMFTVGPAVNLYDFSFINKDERPLTVVQGMADEVVPADKVRAWATGLPQANFYPIEGAGHFFPQSQAQMVDALLAGLPK